MVYCLYLLARRYNYTTLISRSIVLMCDKTSESEFFVANSIKRS